MNPLLSWQENQQTRQACYLTENQHPLPKQIRVVDDTVKADLAYKWMCEGDALLWRGDYHNARQLLQAISRRLERKSGKQGATPLESFHLHRQAQGHRSRILSKLLIPLNAGYLIPLRRAPNVSAICTEVWGELQQDGLVSLRELLGLVGAGQWRSKGVFIEPLGQTIYPYYGVFSPVRGEYLQLVKQMPLPSQQLAFDIGTGTGVLSALLLSRGVKRVIATDLDTRALACAKQNLSQLGYNEQVELLACDMFPLGQAPLIVCNPPWLPAKPTAAIENAIYDPDSRMLKAFLNGLSAHLSPQGEGWLILSDLAEHLGLRSREQLLAWFHQAGLKVKTKQDIRPHHPKSQDKSDPLHAARAAEITSLWCLVAA